MKVLRSVMKQDGSESGIADRTAGFLVVQADASVDVSPRTLSFVALFWL